jgi:hypothetical protein
LSPYTATSPDQSFERKPFPEHRQITFEDLKRKAHVSEAMKFQEAPKETARFKQAIKGRTTRESTWPSPLATENGLTKEKPQFQVFPPKLVAEQITLTYK